VTYSFTGAQYIAPQYFVAVNPKDELEGISSRLELFHWCTLDEGSVLPAFTCREWCRDFVKTYYAGEDSTPPRTLNQDALALAEVLECLEPEGTRYVAFDPMAVAPGKWLRPWQIVTASYCRRLAKEMRPALEKLVAEKAPEVGGVHNPEDLWKLKEVCAPSVSEIVQYAHARTSEWELNDS